MHEREILLAALEKPRPEEREAYLAQACGTDAALRRRVESLLRASEEQDSFLEFLERPAVELLNPETDSLSPKCMGHDELSLDFLQPTDDPQALGRLGYYEILEVLGRGGFGVVLKARDTKLDRIVAVKTLAQSLVSSATARKRFVREAKAAAAVKHENVVGIYHVADDGPVPYLVMECVSGVSLEAKLQQAGTLDLPAILRIGMQIASGLAAAHKQGLVHRDVKPGNILLENGVERVKITDFGLARAADDVAITRTGEVAGTPQYMSPEQAQGLSLDARSDLFSLGSVLYAMGTGRSPFRADSTVAVLRRVCDDTPRPIREINNDIPDWLADIIDQLLAKQPSERFQTATEVADLLGLHLAAVQQSVIVPGPKPAIVSKRRPTAIGSRWWSVAVIALVAVACAIGLTEASGVTKVVPTVIRIVRGEGTLVIEVDDPTVQVSLDGEALSIRGAGLQELRLLPGKYRLHATKDGEPVKDEVVTISRDGRKVVTVTRETGSPVALPGTTSAPLATTTTADWVQLFNGKDLTGWKVPPTQPGNWRVENGLLIGSGPGPFSHLYTEQGDFADFHLRVEAKINQLGNSGVYFRASPQSITKFPREGYEAQICIEREAGSSRQEWQKTGSLFGLVRFEQVPQDAGPDEWFTMEVIARGPRITIKVNGVTTVNDYEDRRFRFHKGHLMLQQGSAETIVCFRKIEIKALSLASKGADIDLGGPGSRSVAPALEQPVGDLTLLAKLEGHSDLVRAVEFLPDGRRMVSVGRDKIVRIWDFKTRSIVSTLPVEGYLRDADVSADGRFIALAVSSTGKGGMIQVWDLQKGQRICELIQAEHRIDCIRLSPDGKYVVTGGFPSGGILWDLAIKEEVQCFQVDDPSPTLSAEFSSDGRILAIGAVGRVRLFDVETRSVLGDIQLPSIRMVLAMAFSSDRKLLACGQMGGHVWLVDVERRQLTTSLPNPNQDAHVHCLQFLDKNRCLLSTRGDAKGDATVEVWDVGRAKLVAKVVTEHGSNKRLGVSPDGRYAVTGSGEIRDPKTKALMSNGDCALRLWQLPESVWPKASRPTSPPADTKNQTPKAGAGAFAVLGGNGGAERNFETLAEAVQAATSGDTIEIRGNGPFVSRPVKITGTPLTIRAGQGFRPVIRLDLKEAQAGDALLETRGTLCVEGVELQAIGSPSQDVKPYWSVLLHALGADARLFVTNCRFVPNHVGSMPIRAAQVALLDVRNSQFVSQSCLAYSPARDSRISLHHNLIAADPFALSFPVFVPDAGKVAVNLQRNTLIAPNAVQLNLDFMPEAVEEPEREEIKAIRIQASGNLFQGAASVLRFEQSSWFQEKHQALSGAEMETMLRDMVDWRGERNGFPSNTHLIELAALGKALPSAQPTDSVAHWNAFWRIADTQCLQGPIRFVGGDLLEKSRTTPELLTPEDHRLHVDGAGYQAGKDGQDLGADVDRVGPGPAYELWKTNPEYEEWLKGLGQVK
jgi:WD40 repeat protein/tRNA A-37 threonylcarbamoyl transferase component Bud32